MNATEMPATDIPAKWKFHQALAWLAFISVTVSLYLIFMWVPNEKVQGAVSKIIYFHIASAWLAFFAFFVVLIGSALYLKTKDLKWDETAHASAEIGILFTTIVLVTGPIWGRASWNVWWTWDSRLTTTLILWFIYIAYLMVRSSFSEEDKKARFSAVFGIIGFVDVPIVWMSIRWWRTIHPTIVTSSGFAMDPRMVGTLMVSLASFTLLYFYLLQKGLFINKMRRQTELLKEKLSEGR